MKGEEREDFTESFDARDWARAFVEHVKLNPDIPTDEGTMLGWFANALMRGYDEHARTIRATTSPAQELGRKVEALLASEEAPESFRRALDPPDCYISAGQLFQQSESAWRWFREQLLEASHGR